MLLQDAGVLGIEKENESHDEHIEASLLKGIRFDVVVLTGETFVQPTYNFACLNRDTLFLDEARFRVVGKEIEQMQLIWKFVEGQGDEVSLRIVGVEVVNTELVEVAQDDPSRTHRMGQVVGIPLRLLIRRLLSGPLGALRFLVEIDSS